MACNSPLSAWQHASTGEVFFYEKPDTRPLTLACGQCAGCRLERSRQWAIRCVHEASMHQQNSFLTLTYDDNNLPEFGTLDKSHLKKFFKRLRRHLEYRGHTKKIRYYACGEYGETTQRAHYHVCLFGHDFADKKKLKRAGEHWLYTSETLADIWGLGNTSIGDLTFETAAYTARYVFKKQLGNKTGGYARVTDEGELIPLEQPFSVMSLKPAIGYNWLQKYHADVYGNEKDFVVLRGHKLKPPKYYDSLYDSINPERLAYLKYVRGKEATQLTPQELTARATITRARMRSKDQI